MKYPCTREYYGGILTEGTSSLPIIIDTEDDDITEYDIPAWSLHRLWELTPKVIFTKPSLYLTMYGDSVVYCAEDNNEEYEKSFSRQISLFDNIIDCIEWLIKEGYFNEEYLI